MNRAREKQHATDDAEEVPVMCSRRDPTKIGFVCTVFHSFGTRRASVAANTNTTPCQWHLKKKRRTWKLLWATTEKVKMLNDYMRCGVFFLLTNDSHCFDLMLLKTLQLFLSLSRSTMSDYAMKVLAKRLAKLHMEFKSVVVFLLPLEMHKI